MHFGLDKGAPNCNQRYRSVSVEGLRPSTLPRFPLDAGGRRIFGAGEAPPSPILQDMRIDGSLLQGRRHERLFRCRRIVCPHILPILS